MISTVSQTLLVNLIIIALFFAACGPESKPETGSAAARAAMATEVVATITAEAKGAVGVEQTGERLTKGVPTYTPTATNTVPPSPTNTPKPTATPHPTDTPRPRPTATPMPGIGDSVDCGNLWRIGALMPPDFSGIITSDPPKGAYAKLYFMLTNLQEQTAELSSGDLQLVGTVEGRPLIFDATYLDTSINEKDKGIASWMDDMPPLVDVKTSVVFDVNPNATDWKLRLTIDGFSSRKCRAEIALRDTRPLQVPDEVEASSQTAENTANSSTARGMAATISSGSINLRSGPGTNYDVAGGGTQGQKLVVEGRNEAGDWYEACCVEGQDVWVASFLVDLAGDASSLPVVQNIPSTPMPAPTSIPVATPTPLSYETGVGADEVQVQNWGLRLYAVKKAKTVYFFGEGEYASGVWLIPLVEFHNLGSGTDKPSASLDFYLQDTLGRTFEYDFFTDGDLGAAWQFQAGHIYDKINPGSVLGVAIPFDVSPDLGDMWLRVEQNPEIAIYLGNVSQLPQEN